MSRTMSSLVRVSKISMFYVLNVLVGRTATEKLADVRAWIKAQPPSIPSYSKAPASAQQKHIGTLITSLPSIGMFIFNF